MKDEEKRRDDYPAFDYEDDNPYNEADNTGQKEKPEGGKKYRSGLNLLTTIQIIGSVVILAAALAVRFSGSDLYQTVRSWYLTAANDSIMPEEQMDQAKHTVVGLWNNISAARSSQSAQSQLSSQKSAVSQAASGAQNAAPKTASSAPASAAGGAQKKAP